MFINLLSTLLSASSYFFKFFFGEGVFVAIAEVSWYLNVWNKQEGIGLDFTVVVNAIVFNNTKEMCLSWQMGVTWDNEEKRVFEQSLIWNLNFVILLFFWWCYAVPWSVMWLIPSICITCQAWWCAVCAVDPGQKIVLSYVQCNSKITHSVELVTICFTSLT